ncbi:jg21298 [Pararge aegeria aegeria]|uniref:Jg21298 protein n=1 Tax=Pararge aegeria aegeria TaxID=348720 RepID=A0A8S4SAS4_9NEOP|nr:jg21298 [Pararge aegeria aegeria]
MFLFVLKISFLLTVASVTGKYVESDDELPELEWPKKYTFEATKVSLTSALVENIKHWRSTTKSRTDYNDGAVKKIFLKAKKRSKKLPFGVKYEIHPETSENNENELFCVRTKGIRSDLVTPENILPDLSNYDFEYVGTDYLDMGEVEKFAYEEEGSKKYLWAYLDRKNGSWIPVRVEELGYNEWLENLNEHVVLDIINFETQFDYSVFSVKKYDCTDADTDEEETNIDESILDSENDDDVEVAFNKFKKEYNRHYATEDEHNMRMNIFQNNMRKVQEHNSKKSSFKLTLNKFSDRTRAEKRKSKGLIRRKAGEKGTHPFPYDKKKVTELADSLPSEFDLRLLGYISPVRDQEGCGSCWTFGTTSAVEGALARSNGGRLLRLANQALVDCAWGIDNMTTLYPIKGFTNVTPFSVEALKIAVVNHGPLSVSIDVGSTELLHSYNGGIFYDPGCKPKSLDHEVTLVGYGEVDGDSYWIVKNSWGRDWGIDGYFHISTRDHACGLTTEPTYVVM